MTSVRQEGAAPGYAGAFGELVVRYRRSLGLGQGELAQRCGLSERAVRSIENGATARPRRHTVAAIGRALGLSGDELSRFVVAGRRVDDAPAPPQAEPVPDGDGGEAGGAMVGREAELRAVAELAVAGRRRMISVTGPAGVGKSRLVAEAVAVVRRRTGLPVHRLDLSAAADPELLGELVAEVLGAGGRSRLTPLDRLAAHLRDQRLLLVLDSFERVAPAAGWVRALVQRCTGLTALVTSQVRLGVDGEREVRLEPLPVPGAARDLAALARVPSVRLLVRRAELARPGFALTSGNAAAIAAVCRKADGLPLALELAAARLRLLTPAELAARLDRRLEMLAGGPHGTAERHRSLRAAIESSLDVVGAPARELFAWLGAAAGSVALDDLEAVAAALGRNRGWLLSALADLVDASLARVGEQGEASRYRLPDAMAELAAELLSARPDAAAVRRAAATHHLRRLLRADVAGHAPARADADNVRAALAWIIRHDAALLDRAAIDAIYRYHESAGRFAEGVAVLTGAAVALDQHSAAGAYARVRAGRAAAQRFDLDGARRLATDGLRGLAEADHAGHAMARLLLGMVANNGGDLAGARRQILLALDHGRRCDDDRLLSRILNNLGNLAMQLGDLTEARTRLTEALAARRRGGSGPADTACTLNNLAEVAFEQGDTAGAITFATEGVALGRVAGHERLVADTLSVLGLALLAEGRTAEALAATAPVAALLGGSEEHHNAISVPVLRRSVILHAAGSPRAAAPILAAAIPMAKGHIERVDLTLTLEWHAWLLSTTGTTRAAATAARLLGAAGRYRTTLQRPIATPDRARIDAAVTAARRTLGRARFDRESSHGAALDQPALVTLCATL